MEIKNDVMRIFGINYKITNPIFPELKRNNARLLLFLFIVINTSLFVVSVVMLFSISELLFKTVSNDAIYILIGVFDIVFGLMFLLFASDIFVDFYRYKVNFGVKSDYISIAILSILFSYILSEILFRFV
jgi:hypothetical protein